MAIISLVCIPLRSADNLIVTRAERSMYKTQQTGCTVKVKLQRMLGKIPKITSTSPV